MKFDTSIEIRRSLKDVFDYLKYTKNQDNFSVWNQADPNMKKEYSGTDGTKGFIYKWDSTVKNVGAGEQETKLITEGKSIEFEVRFSRPMKNVAKIAFLLNSKAEASTTVTWTFDSPSKFPYSLLAPIFKKIMVKDLEKGLSNLKNLLEKN
jgi:hypothetical protein